MNDLSVRDDIKEDYEKYYCGEPEWVRLGAISKTKNIIELCEGYPHKTILDIGSGEGSVLKRMSDLHFGERLYSIDISESSVEAIRSKGISSLEECRLFDGYDIPYRDKAFDLAVLSHVVEHVEYPRKTLYEASRVASYVFIEVPLEYTIRLKNDYSKDPSGHINFYSPKLIRRLAQTCNLVVLAQRVSNSSLSQWTQFLGNKGYIAFMLTELALRVSPWLATKVFTYNYSMICTTRDGELGKPVADNSDRPGELEPVRTTVAREPKGPNNLSVTPHPFHSLD